MTRHAATLKAVYNLVAITGGKAWVTAQGAGVMRRGGRAPLRCTPGIPDLFIMYPSRPEPFAFWCEIKAGKDKLRPAQVEFNVAAEQCNISVVVGGVDEVLAHLRSQGVKAR